MAKNANSTGRAAADLPAIAEIRVAGFKSISDERCIELKPLTILAGANSSGKSSIMQPLLLLKQTLEASYDPGPLLLNGPNVKFTAVDQLLSRLEKGQSLGSFQIGVRLSSGDMFATTFQKEHQMGFAIKNMETVWKGGKLSYWPGMPHAKLVSTFMANGIDLSAVIPEGHKQGQWEIRRDRCFIGPVWIAKRAAADQTSLTVGARPGPKWEEIIPHVIHLPGLRGNPERAYPVTAAGPAYPGTFEKYAASIVLNWINQWWAKSNHTIDAISHDLRLLKLSGGLRARSINDVQIELQVGRLPDSPPTNEEDVVSLADVGLGVSQTLPVLVALHAAQPNQLVYVEQPEAHLHPRAQVALAQVLGSSIKRGVRVIVETHSSLLLIGIQTLVAEGKIDLDQVKLHWFRLEDGRTAVESADLDKAGRFGEWPEDFDDVALQAQKEYLDAADRRLFAQ